MHLSKDLLYHVVAIAQKAGKSIMDIYKKKDPGTTYKDGNSPLTRADMASHHIILEELKAINPDIPILSEESSQVNYDKRQSWKVFWMVDPLDGTKEFIKQNDEFTVNIALINEGKSTLGVVYAPALDITYFGMKNYDVFKRLGTDKESQQKIAVIGYRGGKVKIVASRSHGNKALENFLKKIENTECISKGSSLKFCLVAEGSVHLYPRLGPTMEWDTAAAQCIVEVAGGSVTNMKGQSLTYNKPDLRNPFFIVSGKPSFPWWQYIQKNTLES